MSEPLYPNQPLVEVATEIRFKGDLRVEEIRPQFQARIKEDYPLLMVPGAHEGVAPSLQPIRFESNDRSSGFQLAINSFSHFTRSYPGHDSFLQEAKRGIEIFSALLPSVDVTRTGWRYINAIPFTREGKLLPLERFFRENPYFGNALQRGLLDVNYRAIMPINNKTVSVRLDSAKSSTDLGAETLLLDIDVFELNDPALSSQHFSLVEAVYGMHDAAIGVFERMISNAYRTYLKGESDE